VRRIRNETPATIPELCFALALAFYAMKAAGRQIGAVSSWGGGYWGVLRSLKTEGSQTLIQLARSRPVSRQRIQRIAAELGAQQLVEFRENPAHQRSKLLHLTPKGESFLNRLDTAIGKMAEKFSAETSTEQIAATIRTLEQFRACFRSGSKG